jgi:membrane protease YdiL (CAAX protease family)
LIVVVIAVAGLTSSGGAQIEKPITGTTLPVAGNVVSGGVPGWKGDEWVTLVLMLAGPAVLAVLWMMDIARPGSFHRCKPVIATDQAGPTILLAGVLVFAAQMVGAGVAYQQLPFPRDVSRLLPKGQAVIGIGGAIAGLMAALTVAILLAGSWRRLASARDAILAPALLIVVYPMVVGAASLATRAHEIIVGSPPAEVAHKTLSRIVEDPGDKWSIVLGILAVFVAPVVEEVVYRVCLQTAIIRVTGRAWGAIMLTSALFALSHRGGDAVPWHAVVPLFILSVAMGTAYARTGRLAVAAGMHMAFNALNIAIALSRSG